jgi:hypothetical protein
MSSILRLLVVLMIVVLLPETGFAQRFVPRPPVRPPTPTPRFTPGPHVVPIHSSARGGGQAEDQSWIWWVVGGVFGSVLLGVLLFALAGRKKLLRIRIIDIPPGEAPQHVRAAWVGLELPLFPGETGPRSMEQVEVLSLAKTGAESGFVVDGKQALVLLAEHSPAAAAWWRDNCAAFFEANGCLIFPTEVCERIK